MQGNSAGICISDANTIKVLESMAGSSSGERMGVRYIGAVM